MNAAIATLNQWGGAFLNLAGAMFWQSSLLALVILLLEVSLRRRVRASVRSVAPGRTTAPAAAVAHAPEASQTSRPPVLSADARATEATAPDQGASAEVVSGSEPLPLT